MLHGKHKWFSATLNRQMIEPTEKQKIGQIGEDIAVKYLENKGFSIIERNYRKKYGEIDIVAKKNEKVHFIEVKSVSCESFHQNVSRVTDRHRPEDNIHPYKLKRLTRTIQVYLLESFPKGEPEWVFDAITVTLNMKTKQARVKFLESLVL